MRNRIIWTNLDHRALNRFSRFCSGQRQKKRKGNKRYKKSRKRYISPIGGEAPREQILTKFCTARDMPVIIICAHVCVEKLRGFGHTGVNVCGLSLKRLVTPKLTTVLRYRTACDEMKKPPKSIAL